MKLDLIILLLCTVSIALLGLIVYARSPTTKINKLFVILAVCLIFWTGFNYISDHAQSHNLLFTRLTFLFGIASMFFVIQFVANFPRSDLFVKSRLSKLYTAFTAILIPITLLPQFVESVSTKSLSQNPVGGSVTTGYLYSLFLVYVVLSLAILFRVILTQKNKADTHKQKRQVSTISSGIIIYATLAITSNVVLPTVIDDWSISRFGPVFTLIFVGTVAYSIVKHKTFDIRVVIARTLGYVFSIGALALLYGVIAFFVIGTFIFSAETSQVMRQATYTSLAIVLAFTFAPLKKFFDGATNRLFYRDAYDSQVLLDELNKVLVSTIDLNKLLEKSSEVIARVIKTEFCLFGLKEVGDAPQRIIGTKDKKFDKDDIAAVRAITPNSKVKTIVTDELEENKSKLHDLLRKNDIAVMLRLTKTPTKQEEGIGYILLGNKKSGSPYTRQDIQVLEIIADAMVIAIQNALRFEEIQHFNVTLQDKVDDATGKLRSANKRLIELDQTKDDFISMASHQLRTPLTSIKGYVSMVIDGDVGKVSKKQADLLSRAFVSSQQMVYLIADLLNVSRLRTGKFVIDRKETNLSQLIDGEITQLKETAKTRNIELVYEKPKSFPALMLDETKTRQVIMNFIDNAIYYTPSGGHINITLEDAGGAINFMVKDDGIGVPKSEQHNLFTKFYRAGNAKKARPDGTGLGLFMAKKVVAAQGGSILFSSAENKGSTFGFTFAKKPLLPEKSE